MCIAVSFCVRLIAMHGVSRVVQEAEPPLAARGHSYRLLAAAGGGGARGAAGTQTRERQAPDASLGSSAYLSKAAELNLEQGSD